MRELHRMYSARTCAHNDPRPPRGCGHQPKKSAGERTMALTKRDFLIGAAAASGGVMFSRIDASGQADRRVIDAHTHWYPTQWVENSSRTKEKPPAPASSATTVAASPSMPPASARCS